MNAIFRKKIDVSEGIDVNKTSASKQCNVCHYWYFLIYSFKFQPNLCNRSHDLLMISMDPSDIAVLGDIEIKKQKLHQYKRPISIKII